MERIITVNKLRNMIWNLFVNTIAANKFTPMKLRNFIYKYSGIKIGKAGIYSNQTFKSNKISISNGTFINYNCFFDIV